MILKENWEFSFALLCGRNGGNFIDQSGFYHF